MRVPPCCGGKVVADAEGEGTEEDGSDADGVQVDVKGWW